jgi:peroxiredoxin
MMKRTCTLLAEAHALGDKDAEAALREIFTRRHGSEEGFAEYLAGLLEKGKRTGVRGASDASSGGKEPAPDFSVSALDGAGLKLSDLKGKVAVLNFWFTTCAPCRVEIPGLNKLVEEFADSDVAFIGFALDGADALRMFLGDHPFAYRIVPQAEDIARLYGVTAFPAHVLIDKDGRIAYSVTGGSPDRHEQLRKIGVASTLFSFSSRSP